MIRKLALRAAAALAFAIVAGSIMTGFIVTRSVAAEADGLDPIAIRQVGMDLTGGNFAYVRAVIKEKGDVKQLKDPAKAIARWGKTIPAVFPAGSDKGENTKALPAIWSDRAGFEKAASDMADAATKLVAAATAGDADAVAADTKLLGEACGGCHRHYRAK